MGALFDELTQPISADSFCGEDASYESEFEICKAEIEKLSGNDFPAIEENATRLLKEKSKDIRAFGFLALAAARNSGAGALGEVVQAYAKIAEEQWEALHPQRVTARANAFKWLNGERVVSLIEGSSGSVQDHESLMGAVKSLDALKDLCFQKFPDSPPSFANFAKAVQTLEQKFRPAAQPDPQPASESGGSQAGSGASSAGQGGGAHGSAAGGPTQIESYSDCETWMQRVGQYLISEKPTDPLGYRMMRILRWGTLTLIPPNESGKTALEPPDGEMRNAFAGMFQSQTWSDLARGGEDVFTRDDTLFWFDLQRYICLALRGMGGDYGACAQAIMMELALLVKRLPQLPGLSFDDGTPFADAMTRDWLQGEVKGLLGGGGGGSTIMRKGDVGEESKKAQNLLGEGKLEEALTVLKGGITNDSSEKNNFERRYLMAELCYKANKPTIARAILEDLGEKIEAYGLMRWDPDMTLGTLGLLQKVLLSLADAAEEHEKQVLRTRAFEIHSKISRLDPVTALVSEI